jgi:hypothetical protein
MCRPRSQFTRAWYSPTELMLIQQRQEVKWWFFGPWLIHTKQNTHNTHVPDTADTVTHGWVQTVCLMQGSVGDHSCATRWLPWVSDSDGDNPNRISIRVINSITTVIRVANPSRVVIRVIRGSFLHKLTKVNRAAQPMIAMNTIGDDLGRERGSKNDIVSNIILTSDDIHICDICIDSPYKHHIWPMIA